MTDKFELGFSVPEGLNEGIIKCTMAGIERKLFVRWNEAGLYFEIQPSPQEKNQELMNIIVDGTEFAKMIVRIAPNE